MIDPRDTAVKKKPTTATGRCGRRCLRAITAPGACAGHETSAFSLFSVYSSTTISQFCKIALSSRLKRLLPLRSRGLSQTRFRTHVAQLRVFPPHKGPGHYVKWIDAVAYYRKRGSAIARPREGRECQT